MKAKTILAAALVLISSVTFAKGTDNNKLVVIRGQESGIFKVIFEGEDQVNSTINVLDKEGNIVYTKEIKGMNGFLLPINFKELESGEYQIEVKNGSNTWVETINYSKYSKNDYASAVEKESSIQNVHVSKLKDDGKFLLSIAKTGNDRVTISVFNANNDLLYAETRKTDGDLAVVYDLKGIAGVSKFRITDKLGYSKIIKK